MFENSSIRPPRLTSLDQFRGYTMLGMLLVNFLGGFTVCPKILTHSHDYCSYADTIMPQFLFAAGFAMRLSLGRRWETDGHLPWGRAIRRILGLALLAVAWYSFCDFSSIVERFRHDEFRTVLAALCKRSWYQTLMHIAVTSLWILPVIVARPGVRLLYGIGSGLAHVGLSWWFNFHWVNTAPAGIDGGPLGFLTWCIPAILGTLACDAVRADGVRSVGRLIRWGCVVMFIGWIFSVPTTLYNVRADQQESLIIQKLAEDPVVPGADRFSHWKGEIVEPPFVAPPDATHRKWNYWMMSQRAGSISYTTFAAGVSLVLYGAFLWSCDFKGWNAGIFRTLGTNSLAAYMLHDVASWIVSPFVDEEAAGIGTALISFLIFTLMVYGSCRILEAKKWYLRV